MATRINLLPWRAERRKQRTQQFGGMAVAAVLIGLAIAYGGYAYYAGQIEYQERRNDLLRDEIAQLEERIVKIEELEETKERLLNRMEVIQELQAGRTQIVHLFEQFVTTLPDGLYLTSLEEQGDGLQISGVAESNARVSNYMENLDGSDWMAGPDLSVIEVEEKQNVRISDFTLSVKQSSDKKSKESGDDGDGN